jgi:hypothetical protein
MADPRRIFVITDCDGAILGAAFPTAQGSAGASTGMAALPGQTLHELELPKELLRLETPEEILRHVFKCRLPQGSTRMQYEGKDDSRTVKS